MRVLNLVSSVLTASSDQAHSTILSIPLLQDIGEHDKTSEFNESGLISVLFSPGETSSLIRSMLCGILHWKWHSVNPWMVIMTEAMCAVKANLYPD